MRNNIFLILISSALLTAGCSSTKSASRSTLATCEQDRESCQTSLNEANARNTELSAQIRGQQNDNALAQKRIDAYRKLAEQFRNAFAAGNLKIVLRNGRLVVQLPNAILYDLGKAQLTPDGVKLIETLASVLKTIPERNFLIAGHTDNVPVSQRSKVFKSNWQLSTMRSLGVVLLLQELGVAPTQLAAAGFGEFLPLVDNADKEKRQQNRRTEIIIMPTIEEMPAMPENL